jgi:hypothetical protein
MMLRAWAAAAALQNFMRVEVFGSPNVNWVRLCVVEDGDRVSFEVLPRR